MKKTLERRRDEDPFAAILALADGEVASRSPRMRWMWGEALLCYALAELGAELEARPRPCADGARYEGFAKAYCEFHLARTPRIDQADTVAPGLVALAMERRFPGSGFGGLADRVAGYLKTAPRIAGGALNHLGRSPEGRFYPESVWVDSLMMTGVFAARYGRERNDRELIGFAADMPGLYANLLRDPATGLWYHAYLTKRGRPYPGRGIFWARGNGWVVAALPMILEQLPPDHPGRRAVLELFAGTCEALLPFRRPDGFFDTLLEMPGRSYPEASATALVAAGWMHGLRRGWLDGRFREPALASFDALVAGLAPPAAPGGRVTMGGISGPTIPLPVFPRAGYRFIPRGRNISYGVAALVLAGIEHRRLVDREGTGK